MVFLGPFTVTTMLFSVPTVARWIGVCSAARRRSAGVGSDVLGEAPFGARAESGVRGEVPFLPAARSDFLRDAPFSPEVVLDAVLEGGGAARSGGFWGAGSETTFGASWGLGFVDTGFGAADAADFFESGMMSAGPSGAAVSSLFSETGGAFSETGRAFFPPPFISQSVTPKPATLSRAMVRRANQAP